MPLTPLPREAIPTLDQLTPAQAVRLRALAQLAEQLVRDSGNEDPWDAQAGTWAWVSANAMLLGGPTPTPLWTLLDTDAGVERLYHHLLADAHGVYQ